MKLHKMTLSILVHGITALNISALSLMALGKTALSITLPSIKTVGNITQHTDTQNNYGITTLGTAFKG